MREELRGIGNRIASHFESGDEPPFIVYQYQPDQEWPVRRDFGELRSRTLGPLCGLFFAFSSAMLATNRAWGLADGAFPGVFGCAFRPSV